MSLFEALLARCLRFRDRLDDLSSPADGQGLAEYALILALIAILAIVALIFLGHQISTVLSKVGSSI
jgi:Flp pilus assembly pilin Flp